ncbi:MAG: hypothetical protein JSV75_06545, partial [Candidatus Bathyarchaeota archaeon]
MIWLKEKITPIVGFSHNAINYLGMQSASDRLGGNVNRKKKHNAGARFRSLLLALHNPYWNKADYTGRNSNLVAYF